MEGGGDTQGRRGSSACLQNWVMKFTLIVICIRLETIYSESLLPTQRTYLNAVNVSGKKDEKGVRLRQRRRYIPLPQ